MGLVWFANFSPGFFLLALLGHSRGWVWAPLFFSHIAILHEILYLQKGIQSVTTDKEKFPSFCFYHGLFAWGISFSSLFLIGLFIFYFFGVPNTLKIEPTWCLPAKNIQLKLKAANSPWCHCDPSRSHFQACPFQTGSTLAYSRLINEP